MTSLLEYREMVMKFYSKNSVFILPIVKFLVAFITLSNINSHMPYMERLDSTAIVLIVSLMCSFLPAGSLVLFSALFTLLHMYELSLEVAVIAMCLYLILAFLFVRFQPKDSIVIALTPLLFTMKIPYVIPVVMGLVGSPVSAASVACGIIVYYFLSVVVSGAPTINTMGDDEITAKVHLIVDSFLDNKAMVVTIVAFSITVIVVYLLRRMAVEHCWTIAMIAGAMINIVILLVGDLLYDTNMSVGQAILGAVLAILVGKIIEFFRFLVDFGRTEKVQFEDDEYYYYVKAVPKMVVAEATKTVKKINMQQGVTSREDDRTPAGRSNGNRNNSGRKTASGNGDNYADGAATRTGRSAVTGENVRTSASQSVAGNRGAVAGAGAPAVGRSVSTERTPNPARSVSTERTANPARSVSTERTANPARTAGTAQRSTTGAGVGTQRSTDPYAQKTVNRTGATDRRTTTQQNPYQTQRRDGSYNGQRRSTVNGGRSVTINSSGMNAGNTKNNDEFF